MRWRRWLKRHAEPLWLIPVIAIFAVIGLDAVCTTAESYPPVPPYTKVEYVRGLISRTVLVDLQAAEGEKELVPRRIDTNTLVADVVNMQGEVTRTLPSSLLLVQNERVTNILVINRYNFYRGNRRIQALFFRGGYLEYNERH